MRLALLSLPLLLLLGCTGKRYDNVQVYEESHPYAKRVETVVDMTKLNLATATDADVAKATTRIVFVDNVPSITVGGHYSTTLRTDTFTLADGVVVKFDRVDQ